MPYGLFDYVPDSFHTMGAGPFVERSTGQSFTREQVLAREGISLTTSPQNVEAMTSKLKSLPSAYSYTGPSIVNSGGSVRSGGSAQAIDRSSGSGGRRVVTLAIPENPGDMQVPGSVRSGGSAQVIDRSSGSTGGVRQPVTLRVPENPGDAIYTPPGDIRATTKMAYGEENPPYRPPQNVTDAYICGENPTACRPVTAAIPEDPTQVIKPPTQQGQCPPGYGGPSPEPPRADPIEMSTNPYGLHYGEQIAGPTSGKPFDIHAPGTIWVGVRR